MKLEPNEQWSDHDPDQLEFWKDRERGEKIGDWIWTSIIFALIASFVIAAGYLFS